MRKRKSLEEDSSNKRRKHKFPGEYKENFGLAPPVRTKSIDYRCIKQRDPEAMASFSNSLHVHGYAFLQPGQDFIDASKQISVASSTLFGLSQDEKLGSVMTESDNAGYSTDGFTKEIYMATSPSMMQERLYPKRPALRQAIDNWFNVSFDIACTLLKSLALSLHCEQGEDAFSKFLGPLQGNKDCLVKMIKYLNKREVEDVNQNNAKEPDCAHMMLFEHFDLGLITLSSSAESGLVVYDRSCGEWVFVEKGLANGEVCVLTGSQLQFLTKDYFPATLHAVVATSRRPRFSHIFFGRGQTNVSPTFVLDPKKLRSKVVDEIKGDIREITIEQLNDEYIERNHTSLKLKGLAA